MSKSGKDKQVSLVIDSEVVRQIRKHARSTQKTEVCGVLIGEIQDGVTRVDACISGVNAAQGGAHVTFTQDTWEHIYKIKDRDFPDARMVGWYHSHPGFGIFLSDHDAFIHKNFFSAPEQVAWVFDPVSDEEGCFGWRGSRLERIGRYSFQDENGGTPAHVSNRNASADSSTEDEDRSDAAAQRSENHNAQESEGDDVSRLARTATLVFSHLALLLIGGLLVWYLLPHYVGIPIPVDPQTGRPIKEFMDRLREMSPGAIPPSTDPLPSAEPAPSAAPPASNAQPAPPPASDSHAPQTKGNDGHR
jgi:proteasome lid subunit RPN8/RPN11